MPENLMPYWEQLSKDERGTIRHALRSFDNWNKWATAPVFLANRKQVISCLGARLIFCEQSFDRNKTDRFYSYEKKQASAAYWNNEIKVAKSALAKMGYTDDKLIDMLA